MVKRHERPRSRSRRLPSAAESVGGVIEREGPIHVSNVDAARPQGQPPTRVGIERVDGKRVPRRASAPAQRID